MNERIHQLMMDATKDMPQGYYVPGEYFEKFAELIVRECLDQCYNRGMNDALYAGQLKAAAYIEQHLGVEK